MLSSFIYDSSFLFDMVGFKHACARVTVRRFRNSSSNLLLVLKRIHRRIGLWDARKI
jgi:hypothetical protein